MDITNITICGNLTSDPTYAIRQTKSGMMAVCNFTVGVTQKTAAGEEQKMFFQCGIWGEDAKQAANLQKGTRVTVKGHMRLPSIWVDKEGETHVTQKISCSSVSVPQPRADEQVETSEVVA